MDARRVRASGPDGATKSATFGGITDFGKIGFTARLEQAALVGTMSLMGQQSEYRGEPKAREREDE